MNLAISPIIALFGFFSEPHTDWRADISKRHVSDISFIEYYQYDWKLISKNEQNDWVFGVVIKIKTKPSMFQDLLDKNDKTFVPVESLSFVIRDKDGFIISGAGQLFVELEWNKMNVIRLEDKILSQDIHRIDGAKVELNIRLSKRKITYLDE